MFEIDFWIILSEFPVRFMLACWWIFSDSHNKAIL